MKKVLLFTVFLAVSALCFAQKSNGLVKGTLRDSASGSALHDATVSVITASDSALISFGLSSNSGYFEIKNMALGQYLLLVSYQGFETLRKPFAITEAAPVADLGIVKMQQQYQMMNEVIIRDETPVKVKGDTLAFKADAFKTKPNATVEDLLKKLPGMQVEKDGTVKAQGENVQKVYVDGKEFFGNDPKLATKNLTADMIEEVELYDDKSEQSKFTGVDDGNRSKAINLKLKKDKKKGLFGRASAGYGTDDRFEVGLSANYFKGSTRVSAIARANNTNNLGFTATDNVGIMGNMGGGGGRSTGITRNWTAGLNYTDLWGKKVEVSGSYFYNNINNSNLGKSYRQTFFRDSTVNRAQEALSRTDNSNHRMNLRLTWNIDSVSSIVYTPSLSFQNTESYRNDTTESFAMVGDEAVKVNDSRSVRENTGEGVNWNNNLIYRRKLAKKGRTFSINLSNSINNSDRLGFTRSRLGIYDGGFKLYDSTIDQRNNQRNESRNYGVNLSYTEPIGKDKVLELNYGYNNNRNESDREVFDLDRITGKYDDVNQQQTNLFQNVNTSNRLGSNFRVAKRKYNYQLGMSVQETLLESNNLSRKSVIRQHYTNLFPTAQFNYQFARSKNLRFNYRGRTNQPGVNQLQPIRDVSNPLYQTEGNPALRQEYTNNFSLNYNFFDMVKYRNFFFSVNFANTFNKIVNNVEQLGKGVQLSRPVNADGAYNVNGNFNVGFPIKRMKGGNFNTNTTVGYYRDISMSEGVKNYSNNLTLGEYLRLSYNLKDKLDLSASANITYNSVHYTDTSRRSVNRNTSYYMYAYSLDASYMFPKNFILSTDLDYTTNTGLTRGFNQSSFLWNASLSKQVMKNKRAEVRLSVYDILKQNRSVYRTFADNYIEDVQNTVLQRFFMLSFSYNLNKFGGNTQQRGRGMGGPGQRIMIQ